MRAVDMRGEGTRGDSDSSDVGKSQKTPLRCSPSPIAPSLRTTTAREGARSSYRPGSTPIGWKWRRRGRGEDEDDGEDGAKDEEEDEGEDEDEDEDEDEKDEVGDSEDEQDDQVDDWEGSAAPGCQGWPRWARTRASRPAPSRPAPSPFPPWICRTPQPWRGPSRRRAHSVRATTQTLQPGEGRRVNKGNTQQLR